MIFELSQIVITPPQLIPIPLISQTSPHVRGTPTSGLEKTWILEVEEVKSEMKMLQDREVKFLKNSREILDNREHFQILVPILDFK